MKGKTAEEKRDEIDRWHKARGWKGFGYHEFIANDGTRAAGRPLNQVGAHVYGHNQRSIGVCLEGGHGAEKDDPFHKHFSAQQEASLREYIDEMETLLPIERIRGHSEVANKACPGFNVAQFMAEPTREPRTSMLQSTTLQAAAGQTLTAIGTIMTALSALEGTVQLVVIGFGLFIMTTAGWIARERILKWLRGVK
ncbi:UNVERIFIED_CONTAM: hypothetical protein GTU68_050089 [Idotea baltica]|nr:hypothetical protein [Idotea baltica]